MYFSRNQFSDRLKAFNVLTHGFVYDEKDEETRNYLKRILTTAHKLVTKKIEDADIEFDIYEIVILMTAEDRVYMREYLMHINPENISDADYITLNSVLVSMISDNSEVL